MNTAAAGIGRVRVRDRELTMLELPRLVARHNALATRLAA